MTTWIIPYVDQPLSFWEEIADKFGPYIKEVYFPVPDGTTASGRSRQPEELMDVFLRNAPLPKSVLVNPIVLPRPVEEIGPQILDVLKQLHGDFGVSRVTVTNLALARLVKETLPEFKITASVLMDIATPLQALMAQDCVDAIAPSNRLVRDLRGLKRLRLAFPGEIRLLVNEACLPGCPYRTQHFYEMGYGQFLPKSLCQQMLDERPWLRLTGAWILPQHLVHYEGLYDSLKLAGRVTLRERIKYLTVLEAYVQRRPLLPGDIGGGPASVLEVIGISDEWFEHVLYCAKNCHTCLICQDYYKKSKLLNTEENNVNRT
jgi:hypothetical protein